MGLEYCLANHKDKTAFELGKGSWSALTNSDRKGHTCLLKEDAIYEMICEEVWEYYIANPGANDPAGGWLAYAREVARDIHKFVNNADPDQIEMCNDSDDTTLMLQEKGYRWVGSRYISDKENNLASLNEHLKD
jgi:hypothetical protein